MGVSPFRGFQLPDRTANPGMYDVRGLAPGDKWDVALLSDAMLVLPTHWVWSEDRQKWRSILCILPEECACLEHGHKLLWLAFLPVVKMPEKRCAILRLGAESARALANFSNLATGLRGQFLHLERSASEPTRALAVSRSDLYTGKVPPPFPIEPTLQTMFGVARLPSEIVEASDRPPEEAP